MTVYYACCQHCHPEHGGFHPMKRNEHIGPCPQGCNDEPNGAQQ